MISKEQLDVVNFMTSNDSINKIVSVNSVAGSGKTSTAEAVIDALKPNKCLYTAFNKAIIVEGSKRFKNYNVSSKTLHALAYNYIKPKKGISNFTYSSIKEFISYSQKNEIIEVIGSYFRSKYISLDDFYKNYYYHNWSKEIVLKYIKLMDEDTIPVSFDFLLKKFHSFLLQGKINLELDLLILDECADLTEVTLEIFKLINSKRKIMFGDKYQNIYQFMNTISAFDKITDSIDFNLTQSFRCNNKIAEIVQNYGTKYLDKNFKFIGTDNIINENKIAYLSWFNSSNILTMDKLINQNLDFNSLKDIDTIFELPILLTNLSIDNFIYNKNYKYILTEYQKWSNSRTSLSFFSYISSLGIPEVNNCITLLDILINNKINIFKLKDKINKSNNKKSNIIISTVHAFKGLEADTIYINKDLSNPIKYIDINNKSEEDKQICNLYYVALTRAKHNIIFQ